LRHFAGSQAFNRVSRPAQKAVFSFEWADTEVLAAAAKCSAQGLCLDAQTGGGLFGTQQGAGVGSRGLWGAHIVVLFLRLRHNDIQPDGMAKIWRESGGILAEKWRKLAPSASIRGGKMAV
jgi:hypothetical protein